MTKLMTENGDHFLWFTLLNECIVDHNMLLPWQTKEIGIAVSTPLAAIDDV